MAVFSATDSDLRASDGRRLLHGVRVALRLLYAEFSRRPFVQLRPKNDRVRRETDLCKRKNVGPKFRPFAYVQCPTAVVFTRRQRCSLSLEQRSAVLAVREVHCDFLALI